MRFNIISFITGGDLRHEAVEHPHAQDAARQHELVLHADLREHVCVM